jgi:hypothetical protein
MSEEQASAPQLTSDGVRVLSDALSRRTADRHNTLVAQRGARRRESDALRVAPPSANEQRVSEPEVPTSDGTPADPTPERLDETGFDFPNRGDDGPNWRLLIALGAGIVACVALAMTIEARPVGSALPASGLDIEITEVLGASTNERTSEFGQTGVDASNGRSIGTSNPDDEREAVPSASGQVEGIEVDPAAFQVSVYDEDPAVGGVHSFALRVKSVATTEEFDTAEFDVVVVAESGTEAATFTRFVHQTLPVGSSALATIRAEGAGTEPHYVVVRVGEIEIARILIES